MSDNMKTYYISITEILNRVVAVEAENLEQALDSTKTAYENADIVLTPNDYVGYQLDDETEETEGLINDGYVNISKIKTVK